MALDDYFEPEIAVTAVVTAVLFSPRARKMIRRGAVYGVAGLLRAGDAVTAFAGNVRQGVQDAGNAVQKAQPAANRAKVEAVVSEAAATNTTHKKTASKSHTEGEG